MKLVVKSKGHPHHMLGFIFTDKPQEVDVDEGIENLIRSMPEMLEVLDGKPAKVETPKPAAITEEDTDPGIVTLKGKKKGK